MRSSPSVQSPVTVTVVHIALRGVTRPGREGFRHARGAEYGERQNEDHRLRATVEGTTEDVVVLLEPAGVVAAEPELRDEADDDARPDGRVCAGRHPGGVHVDDGEHDGVDPHTADHRPFLYAWARSSVSSLFWGWASETYLGDEPLDGGRDHSEDEA